MSKDDVMSIYPNTSISDENLRIFYPQHFIHNYLYLLYVSYFELWEHVEMSVVRNLFVSISTVPEYIDIQIIGIQFSVTKTYRNGNCCLFFIPTVYLIDTSRT